MVVSGCIRLKGPIVVAKPVENVMGSVSRTWLLNGKEIYLDVTFDLPTACDEKEILYYT